MRRRLRDAYYGVAIGDNKVAIETGVVATIKLLYTSKLVCVWQMWQ